MLRPLVALVHSLLALLLTSECAVSLMLETANLTWETGFYGQVHPLTSARLGLLGLVFTLATLEGLGALVWLAGWRAGAFAVAMATLPLVLVLPIPIGFVLITTLWVLFSDIADVPELGEE